MPVLILASRADTAAMTIRDALLQEAAWEDAGSFEGLPVRRSGAFLLAEIEGMHLYEQDLDRRLRNAGFAFDVVLFASRHRAESGKPALTVHPLGNFDRADLGGQPRRLVPTAPAIAGRILRALAREAKGTKHEVTFEATHHGPYLDTPAMFVEIGTDEAAWRDPDLGRRVARAMLAAATPTPYDAAPTLVALGGSHYMPRARDLVLKGRANFGHMVPTYALERGLPTEIALELVTATPGCAGYYLDPKLEKGRPEEAVQVFASLELGWWTDAELPTLDSTSSTQG